MVTTPTIGSLSGVPLERESEGTGLGQYQAESSEVTIPCRICEKGSMKRIGVSRFGDGMAALGALIAALSGFGLLFAVGVLGLFLYSAAQVMQKAPADSVGYVTGVGLGTSFGIGVAAVVGLPSLFFFVVGLVLTRQKMVWKCHHCNSTTPA